MVQMLQNLRSARPELRGFCRLVNLKYSSIACRVWSVSSNRTGLPVLLCRTVAQSSAYPFGATSSTRMATTSQAAQLAVDRQVE
jgi:hypothetical protein